MQILQSPRGLLWVPEEVDAPATPMSAPPAIKNNTGVIKSAENIIVSPVKILKSGEMGRKALTIFL